jgi:ElaB/YqjD/DUF883 family membrane-anchored ribosome-binding protein
MTPDLQTTNTWLAILAIAGALQSLLLLGTAFGLFRIYRRTASALEALEQRHLAPISARASLIMDDLQDVTARVRNVDDAVRAKLQGLDAAAAVAKDVVRDRLWPVVGVARAVGAGLRVFTNRPPTQHVTVPDRPIHTR